MVLQLYAIRNQKLQNIWIACKNGFFSIVKIQNENNFFIRARCKNDLLNCFEEDRIIKSPNADYRYRVIVSKQELNDFMLEQSEIDYHNFKDSLYNTNQHDKSPYYHKIWSVMYGYQSAGGIVR